MVVGLCTAQRPASNEPKGCNNAGMSSPSLSCFAWGLSSADGTKAFKEAIRGAFQLWLTDLGDQLQGARQSVQALPREVERLGQCVVRAHVASARRSAGAHAAAAAAVLLDDAPLARGLHLSVKGNEASQSRLALDLKRHWLPRGFERVEPVRFSLSTSATLVCTCCQSAWARAKAHSKQRPTSRATSYPKTESMPRTRSQSFVVNRLVWVLAKV